MEMLVMKPPHIESARRASLCVVLARAGSKGLPGKNGLVVAGRSMLDWTLDHALASTRVDRIVLSTDGAHLAEVAARRGVSAVMRPPDLANDSATVDAAVRHAVESLGGAYEQVVILYGNVPVRPGGLIDAALDKLTATGCDSVQSVCPVGKMHPFWMRRLGGSAGDSLENYQPNQVFRRQDLPPAYMLDGGIIAVTRASLFTVREGEPHAFLGDDRRAIVTEPGAVVDVDCEIDLHVAEALLRKRIAAQTPRLTA